ncbi:Isotrichodermin C-15 hydroxylase [Sphaceloma murrayae]|uniref:Isotrichodermin C-15 hydroxylase n=1 Tax=Sphaceloma murrayae TaxID=2082308 RepID=A0A2K1QNG1_9PEZI|nr:Isotrichodermin C-15 hydroxylase [Sphaceloma murrayae]
MILTIPVLGFTLFLLYRFILYPVLISPLSRIPTAHWSSPFCPLWLLHLRRRGSPNATIHALHQLHGPLLRLAPNEISVNCVDGGIRTVYGGGYEKDDWYAVFRNYGVSNVFSSSGRAEHSRRKRMMSNVYAKSTVTGSETMRAVARRVLGERLMPGLSRSAEMGEEVEMYALFSGAAMDFVTGYVFGLKCGSDFLRDVDKCRQWLIEYKARQDFIFWPQEMPRLTAVARAMGVKHWLVPKWVDQANENIEAWIMTMCDAADRLYPSREQLEDGDKAAVYNQLRTMMKKTSGQKVDAALTSLERLEIASELLDHVAAGFDTTGITLTYLAWELSKRENQTLQAALRKELRDAWSSAHTTKLMTPPSTLDHFKPLDDLPLLNAIIMESLRLHAAIPGIQPRVTPQDAELGPEGESVNGLPAGVRVTSQAYSLHLNESVFPRAHQWQPRRWLDSDGNLDLGGEKARWFWAFGSGGRMCIGSNLAMLEMKSLVATIWAQFTTDISDDTGMAHKDGYTSEPLGTDDGSYLRLRFAAVNTKVS